MWLIKEIQKRTCETDVGIAKKTSSHVQNCTNEREREEEKEKRTSPVILPPLQTTQESVQE
jgi:hypothetical protein